jgi:hypothetical protein
MGRFDRNEVIAALAMMAFGAVWLYIGLGYSWGSTACALAPACSLSR